MTRDLGVQHLKDVIDEDLEVDQWLVTLLKYMEKEKKYVVLDYDNCRIYNFCVYWTWCKPNVIIMGLHISNHCKFNDILSKITVYITFELQMHKGQKHGVIFRGNLPQKTM